MSLKSTARGIASNLLKPQQKPPPPPPPRIEPPAQNLSAPANRAGLGDSFATASAVKAPATKALAGLSNPLPGPDRVPLPGPLTLPLPFPGIPFPTTEPKPSGQGFSEPVFASELPDVPAGSTGVLTLNLANGKEDQGFREAENRTAQAKLIEETGASVLALQEVDVGVNRSGNVNTALDVVRQVKGNESFDRAFTPEGELKPDAPPGSSKRAYDDGSTLFQTDAGTLVTGTSFTAGPQHQIEGDAGPDASYGNALYVGKPNQVVDAYTVVLPGDPNNPGPAVDLVPQGDGKLTEAQRDQLAARNNELRTLPGEPRSALVARVVGEDGRPKTIINTHLATSDNEELRKAQLQYVSQIVNAERQAQPPREVVVLGDLNSSPQEVEDAFTGAGTGLQKDVGGNKASFGNYDQVWSTPGLNTHTSAQVFTQGVTDHQYAGYTVIP
jgi:endonuclease/exonuclease/phosphatase family metal-dependent hydrolase